MKIPKNLSLKIKLPELSVVLMLFGMLLVCVWPMQHTIAIRNVALICASLLSFWYLMKFFSGLACRDVLMQLIPLVSLGFLLCWVVLHYFLFAQDLAEQFRELTGTWLRCLLSLISGLAIGLVVSKNLRYLWFLSFGLFISFAVLYGQYLIKVLPSNSLLQIDFSNYIFYGKHNVVLQGTLLISVILAFIAECQFYSISFGKKLILIFASILIFGSVLFCYVFMFDTRNGIGIAFILTIIWAIFYFDRSLKKTISSNQLAVNTSLMLIIIILVFSFGKIHSKFNLGWEFLFEDIKVAVQVDEYRNWINPKKMGYPLISSGRQVAGSTYERIAWGVAASRLIIQNPVGNGVLNSSFGRALKKCCENLDIGAFSSHSSWLELGLAFGWPALILSFGAILRILVGGILKPSTCVSLQIFLGCGLLLVFIFVELIGQHGLESFFFWIAFLSGLQFFGDNSKKDLKFNKISC